MEKLGSQPAMMEIRELNIGTELDEQPRIWSNN